MPAIVIHATRGPLVRGWVDVRCPILNQNLLARMTIVQQLRHIAKAIRSNPDSEVVQIVVSTTELSNRLLLYATDVEGEQGLNFVVHHGTDVEVESFGFDIDRFLGEHDEAIGVSAVGATAASAAE